MAEKLIGKGYELKIMDRNVEFARLVGTNREFIDREIPHLERLLAANSNAVRKVIKIDGNPNSFIPAYRRDLVDLPVRHVAQSLMGVQSV